MYCFKCGGQNPDQASFCSTCGQNIKPFALAVNNNPAPMITYPQVNSAQERINTRTSEIAEMNKMIFHFSQKQQQYNEYDMVCNEISSLYMGPSQAGQAFGILFIVFGFALTVIFIMMSVLESYYFMVPVFIILMTVNPGFFMIRGHKKNVKEHNIKLAQANQRYDELSTELFNHYLAYGPCLVGCEYTNPSNLSVILYTIQSGRADTIKDAINLLAEENYRRNMQAIAQQTARSAAAAARGAKTAAVFSAANFFLR